MNKKQNTPKELSGKSRNANHRSLSESKLERRQFALPMKQQQEILKEYRDRGLAYGRGSHGVPESVLERQQAMQKQKNMETTLSPESKNRVFFVDIGDWAPGKTIMYALVQREDGRESLLARIEMGYDDNVQQATYRAYSYKGEEVAVPGYSLARTKKEIRQKGEDLLVQLDIDESLNRNAEARDVLNDILNGRLVPPEAPIVSPLSAEFEKPAPDKKRARPIRSRTVTKSRSR